MPKPPILTKMTHWDCPNCDFRWTTTESRPHTQFHRCKKNGLTAPLREVGTRCKIEFIERQDYIRDENPQYDSNGRPIMAIKTTRDDGEDCAVLAPCAGVISET